VCGTGLSGWPASLEGIVQQELQLVGRGERRDRDTGLQQPGAELPLPHLSAVLAV
jgi:hypothetical protein